MTTQSLKPRQDTTQTQPERVLAEPYGPIVLRLPSALRLTDDQLAKLSSLNEALRIEINAQGDLELFPLNPTIVGAQNAHIITQLVMWQKRDGRGVAFGPTAGFTLPNGAIRAPDVSWVLKSRLAELTDEEKHKFAPICPDFVIELRSSSDTLRGVQAKMEEYMENGVRLGWLIDPLAPLRRVYIYRPGAPVEILESPETLSGEPELPGFTLDLNPVWEPAF